MQREYVCRNAGCVQSQEVASATPPADDPIQLCGGCGGAMEVALHPIASVWVGEITAKYLDKSKDGGNAKSGAHWAWEKDKVTGKSTPRLIETWQQQKEFCKSQGIARPSEMPNNWEVSADGTKTLNTVGMPGCEV